MSFDDEEIAHSERGPSTAHRWRKCPGSVRQSRGIPNSAGIEAAYGTVFHEFAAICIEQGLDPQGFVGATMVVEPFGELTFDQEMADNMLPGLDLIRAYMSVPGAKTIVEKRVDLTYWVGPKEFGTTDCAVIDIENWRMVIFDWKYGAGVPVSPVRNDQALLYGLGTWTSHAHQMFSEYLMDTHGDQALDAPWEDDIELIVIIEQPRAQGGGGVWTTTVGEMLAEGERIRIDAKATEDPDAPIIPGPDQCKFCPAAKAMACPEKPRFLLKLAGADFDDLEGDFQLGSAPQIPKAFTPEQRSQLLLHKAMFDKMFETLHESAYHDAEKGRPVPGLKLVPGRSGARAWKDEQKARPILQARFGDNAFSRKLLSPTQIEEKVGKKEFGIRFKRHVKDSERKNVLVPVSDKRKAVRSYAQDFDDLLDDDLAIV
jgi:hypothetical protein